VETFGYDAAGNLSTVGYPPLVKGGPSPTRTIAYDGWKITAVRDPGGPMGGPQAKLVFDDAGKLTSLEPKEHDTKTLTYEPDQPQKGSMRVTLTDRTHLAGQNPLVKVDDGCALVQTIDSQKFVTTYVRDARHQLVSMTDPKDPAKSVMKVSDPMNARDRWGGLQGKVDDELGEEYVLAPTDEDGREGRAPSSFTAPDGKGTIVYAKDDPTATNLPSWASDLPSDESWTTTVADDSGGQNMLVLGKHHTYANTNDPACPRQIVDTDKVTGLATTSCLSGDGSKVLSFTDGYGLVIKLVETDDPVKGQTQTFTEPDGEQEVEARDAEGRLLTAKTMGFGDEEDIAYYDNGMRRDDAFPMANVQGAFHESESVDPNMLLDTGDDLDDGNTQVEGTAYTYYPEGVPKETDEDYASANGTPVGQQTFDCPWWAPGDACK
jgi:YD repeat-containing protein